MLGHPGDGKGFRTAVTAAQHHHLVLGDEFFRCGTGYVGTPRVVFEDEFQLLAVDAAGRIELIEGQLKGFLLDFPELGLVSRYRQDNSHLDAVLCLQRRHYQGQQHRYRDHHH